MKNYYQMIVDLSSQKCGKDDYSNKQKVKKHNKAMTKLNSLDKELNNVEGETVLLQLLHHKSEQVVLSSAMLCLKLNFHVEEAKKRIAFVRDTSKDSIISFNAEMMLKNLRENNKKS